MPVDTVEVYPGDAWLTTFPRKVSVQVTMTDGRKETHRIKAKNQTELDAKLAVAGDKVQKIMKRRDAAEAADQEVDLDGPRKEANIDAIMVRMLYRAWRDEDITKAIRLFDKVFTYRTDNGLTYAQLFARLEPEGLEQDDWTAMRARFNYLKNERATIVAYRQLRDGDTVGEG